MSHGKILLGFTDFFDDTAYVGAPKPTPKPVVKTPAKPTLKPGTKTLYGKVAAPKQNKDIQIHAAVLAKGRSVAARAAQSALNATRAAAKVVRPVSIGQRGEIYLGQDIYIGAVTRTLTPKQKAAVSKSQAASAKSHQLAIATQKAAVATRNAASTLAKKMIAQKAVSLAIRGKKTPAATRIHGEVLGGNVEIGELIGTIQDQVFGDYYNLIGAHPHPDYPGHLTNGAMDPAYFVSSIGDSTALPDPNNPGFLTDGTPDPNYQAGAPATPATSATTTSTAPPDPNNPGFLTDGTPDPNYTGTATAAAPAGADPLDTANLPNAQMFPISQPVTDLTVLGAIMYDGTHGRPSGFIGSLGYFTGATAGSISGGEIAENILLNPLGFFMGGKTDFYGFVFGGNPNDSNWPGDDPNQWIEVHGHRWGHDWWDAVGDKTQDGAISQQSAGKTAPNGQPYGPIVGNPSSSFQGGIFANMRVDFNGNIGWLPQEAPSWVTFPLKQAAALTAKAAAAAAAQAAAADAAAQAKAQSDAAAAQAAQDAQNALAESQSQSDANVAQTQQETQANALLVQQAQQQADAQKAQQDQETQANALLLQQAQQQPYPPGGMPGGPVMPDDGSGDPNFDPSAQFADDGSNMMPGNPNADPFADQQGPFGDDGSNAMPDDPSYDAFADQGTDNGGYGQISSPLDAQYLSPAAQVGRRR